MPITDEITEVKSIEARLGAKLPPGVARLDPDHLRDLSSAIDEARHRQAAALGQAGDEAFRRVPWLLRGPIRKIMGA